MPSPRRLLAALCLALLGSASASRADLSLPAIFSEHMVLQRSAATPVWGKAGPGERVTLRLSRPGEEGVSATATAGADGRWRAALDLSDTRSLPAGESLRFVAEAGRAITFHDVLVGEVWLASGQSNMAQTMRVSGTPEEIAGSTNPAIRFFTVGNKALSAPRDDVSGSWTLASPANTPRFSAVAYYFARRIHAELGQPVGIIHSSWGGSPIEAWTSFEALQALPELAQKTAADIEASKNFPATKAAWLSRLDPWLAKHARQDRPASPAEIAAFAREPAAGADWTTIRLPGRLPGERILWVRRELEVRPHEVGKDLALDFEEILGLETIYFDGVEVGARTWVTFDGEGRGRLNARRQYRVPAAQVTAGKHVLAIRLYAPLGEAGLLGGYFSAGGQNLGGDWLWRTEHAFAPLDAAARADMPPMLKAPLRPWNVPASLYNGMIHGIVPYALRGVLWYQGESNSGEPALYRHAFPALIRDWRARWAAPELSFYWCQLPAFSGKTDKPDTHTGWAAFREAQASALALPRTGQAVIIDTGEAGDVHPLDKRTPGERLAALALARDYGRELVHSGPTLRALRVEGSKLRLEFDHLGGGLVARPVPAEYLHVSLPSRSTRPLKRNSPDSPLEGFAVRGAPGEKWEWANANIEGDTVVVWSPKVPAPQAVRHAWAPNPTVNLFNAAGFPAAPFRTDND